MEKNNLCAVIMAGGTGTRFWPASREDRPKQFLDILDEGESLLQMTYRRFRDYIPAENIFVVAGERYRELTQKQLPDLPQRNYIAEPGKKNTAACILLSAFHIQALLPDSVMIVSPSDHYIAKPDTLKDGLLAAAAEAQKNKSIVTLGIRPQYAATGYGYIQCESTTSDRIQPVRKFVEKPNREKAQEYLDSRQYLWNSGMFVWRTDVIINEFKKHAPEIFSDLKAIEENPMDADLVAECYQEVKSTSVDYAILEKATQVEVIPIDPGWSDLGTWNALHDLKKGEDSNVLLNAEGTVLESENTFAFSATGKKIVLYGIKDLNIIDMDDVLLVMPKEKDQEIKTIFPDIEKLDKELL